MELKNDDYLLSIFLFICCVTSQLAPVAYLNTKLDISNQDCKYSKQSGLFASCSCIPMNLSLSKIACCQIKARNHFLIAITTPIDYRATWRNHRGYGKKILRKNLIAISPERKNTHNPREILSETIACAFFIKQSPRVCESEAPTEISGALTIFWRHSDLEGSSSHAYTTHACTIWVSITPGSFPSVDDKKKANARVRRCRQLHHQYRLDFTAKEEVLQSAWVFIADRSTDAMKYLFSRFPYCSLYRDQPTVAQWPKAGQESKQLSLQNPFTDSRSSVE